MKDKYFTANIEKLVKPVDVGSLHLIQRFTGALPLKTQKKMILKTAKEIPYMGFVVEPYSFFLCYELKDPDRARKLLPKGFKLAKTAIFKGGEEKYYAIFGIFNAHTSGFWGLRMEFYLIAEDEKTNLMSWVIIDYDTNTISYDPKNGLKKPNAKDSIFTIDFNGTIIADINNTQIERKLSFTSNIKNGIETKLDYRLWVEGNLSITYSPLLSDSYDVFSLIFDPLEFEKGLRIDKSDLKITNNNWYTDIVDDQPDQVLCFPYAQHFLSDSPGAHSQIKRTEDIEKNINAINFDKIDSFSSEPIINMLGLGVLTSSIISTIILILYFLK